MCIAVLLAALATASHAQLRIGQPYGVTGSAAAGVKENTEGAKLYIDSINRQGGVHGQQIELITMGLRGLRKVLPPPG